MGHTLEILLEVFTWVGFLAGAGFGVVWLIALAADGTWASADAVIEPGEGGRRVAHWFAADGSVARAPLSVADEHRIGDADTARIYYRLGSNRMRPTLHSPFVRLAGWLSLGCILLGVLATTVSLVGMFAAG